MMNDDSPTVACADKSVVHLYVFTHFIGTYFNYSMIRKFSYSILIFVLKKNMVQNRTYTYMLRWEVYL